MKAESVLLTMIPKTHFNQNITCSLFCQSASHICFELVSFFIVSELLQLDEVPKHVYNIVKVHDSPIATRDYWYTGFVF